MSGSRFAYLDARGGALELALVQWVMGDARRARASRRSRRRCSCASRRWRRPGSSRPTARRCTRSTAASCSSSARARCRSRRCTAARSSPPTTLPLRYVGHLVVLPARGRHLRQGHARHLPRAPVRQGRDVLATPTPTTSWEEHERLLAIEEAIVGGLGLPYRVVNIAAGDLGAAAAKKYDIEVWLPSEGAVPRAHVVLELPRLLGPPARHTRSGRRRRQPARAHAQRHRVRDRRARSCSCSSTTRTPTAASPSPRCCARTPASTGRNPQGLRS